MSVGPQAPAMSQFTKLGDTHRCDPSIWIRHYRELKCILSLLTNLRDMNTNETI